MKTILTGIAILTSISTFADSYDMPNIKIENESTVYFACDVDPLEACKRINDKYTYGKDVSCEEMGPSFIAEGFSVATYFTKQSLNWVSYGINSLANTRITGYFDYCHDSYVGSGRQCQRSGREDRVGRKKVTVLNEWQLEKNQPSTRELQPGFAGNSVNIISKITCEE